MSLLTPLQHRYAELAADPELIHGVLRAGAARMRQLAAPTLARAKAAIGLLASDPA
jgi:tryptophanyl-tRNA synthetase